MVGEGSEVRAGSQAMGSGERLPYGMSMADVAELAVRTAQLSVVQDVHLRELRTVMTRVAVKADSTYGLLLEKVEKEWKEKVRGGTKGPDGRGLGSKAAFMAAPLLSHLFEDEGTTKEVRALLDERWKSKDTSTPEFLTADVNVLKYRTTRDGKEGILEMLLVRGLESVEEEIVRRIQSQGGRRLTGTDSKGRRVRDVEQMIEDTWRRGDRAD